MGKRVCGYGLVAPEQIKQFAQAVCNVLGGGEGNAAVYLLYETDVCLLKLSSNALRTTNGFFWRWEKALVRPTRGACSTTVISKPSGQQGTLRNERL